MSSKYARVINRPRQQRWFQCPECGAVVSAHKWRGHFTGAGHIKTMWCWQCQHIRDFVQLKEDEPNEDPA
jgi:transcription elongation factor Elf1